MAGIDRSGLNDSKEEKKSTKRDVKANKEKGDTLRSSNAEALRKDAEARGLKTIVLEEQTLKGSVDGKTIPVGPEGPEIENPQRGQSLRARRQHDIVLIDPEGKSAVSIEQVTTTDAGSHKKKLIQQGRDETAVAINKTKTPETVQPKLIHVDSDTGTKGIYVGGTKVVGSLPPAAPDGKLPPIPHSESPTLKNIKPIELDNVTFSPGRPGGGMAGKVVTGIAGARDNCKPMVKQLNH
jgi:hypothetical protein